MRHYRNPDFGGKIAKLLSTDPGGEHEQMPALAVCASVAKSGQRLMPRFGCSEMRPAGGEHDRCNTGGPVPQAPAVADAWHSIRACWRAAAPTTSDGTSSAVFGWPMRQLLWVRCRRRSAGTDTGRVPKSITRR